MSSTVLLVGLAAAAAVLASCGSAGDAGPSADPSSTGPTSTSGVSPGSATSTATTTAGGATALPLGKAEITPAPGLALSPEGFTPRVALTVPQGWTSAHRYPDAFDLGLVDASGAAQVIVAVLRTTDPDAATALATVRSAQPSARATSGQSSSGGLSWRRLELVGGTGTAVASRDGNVSLDGAPGQTLRLLATDVAGARDGGALVAVIMVPPAPTPAEQASRLERGQRVVDSLRLAP